MPLPSSGAISLNQIHIEAGGSSGTQASINDADIRALIGKGSGVQMSFSEWYGASAGNDTADMTAGSVYVAGKFPATYYGYNDGALNIANPTGNQGFGTAHDATIRTLGGTDITVRTAATASSTIGNYCYFYIAGNYGGQTVYSLFGGSQLKWGSTVIGTYNTTVTFTYNASGNYSHILLTYNATAPSSGRYTVDAGQIMEKENLETDIQSSNTEDPISGDYTKPIKDMPVTETEEI